LIFAAVVAFQYGLTRIPARLAIGGRTELNPAKVQHDLNELVIDHPIPQPGKNLLIGFDGESGDVIEAHFENARLSDETVSSLTQQGYDPPAILGKIDFLSDEPHPKPGAGPGCTPSVSIRFRSGPNASPPASLRLFQPGGLGEDEDRHFEIKSCGGELLLQIETHVPDGVEPDALGCSRLLTVGDWQQSLSPPLTVGVVVQPESAFRLAFRPVGSTQPSWATTSGTINITVGELNAQERSAFVGARAVSIVSTTTSPGDPPMLTATSIEGEAPLQLSDLKVGSEDLQIRVTGTGWLDTNGHRQGLDVMETLAKNQSLAALLTAGNAGLISWLVRLAIRKPKPARKPRRNSKAKRAGAGEKAG
jgi:hypothetical protein